MKAKSLLIILLLFLLSKTEIIYSQTFEWAKQEGAEDIRESARKTVFDRFGNMYTIGTFGGTNGGTTNIGNIPLTSHGQGDVFIAKYNSNRELIWIRYGGSIYYDYIYGLEIDMSGNVIVSGIFSKSIGNFSASAYFGSTVLMPYGRADLFIIKYNAGGDLIRAKSFGSSEDDQLNGMSSDASGNLYITGGFKNNIFFDNINLINSNSSYQNFIVKFNSDVNAVWGKNSVGITSCIGTDVVSDEAGNTVTTGFFSGSISFDNVTLTSHGSNDIILIKHDPSGKLVWAKSYGGNELDYGLKVDMDSEKNIVLTGSYELTLDFGNSVSIVSRGGADIFISRFDSNGVIRWAKEGGGPDIGGFTSDESPSDIIADSEGNSFLTGYFVSRIIFENDTLSTVSGGSDVYIIKYDKEGNIIFKKTIYAPEGGHIFSSTLSRNLSDDIFVSGSFNGTAQFDNITLHTEGIMDDLYIANLSSLTSIGHSNLISIPEFRLYQNFPNPFNPVTQLEFVISKTGFVSLTVYDMLGKEVKILVNEIRTPGRYTAEFNGSDKAGGVYYCRLAAGEFNDVKTMVMIK